MVVSKKQQFTFKIWSMPGTVWSDDAFSGLIGKKFYLNSELELFSTHTTHISIHPRGQSVTLIDADVASDGRSVQLTVEADK